MSVRIPFTKLAHNPTKPQLVLANGSEFLVVNSKTGDIIRGRPDNDQAQKYQELHRCISFSHDGSLLATSGEDKEIRVWNTSDWSQIVSLKAKKRVNALCFNKTGNEVIIADKSGDGYRFLLDSEPVTNQEPILGHVSMVTDMTMSSDNKYIITADRDEHIRVSHFPNSYSIETFCLGHTDVLTCLRTLPWAEHILVSAGGDCTIRLWDFEKGKELQSLDIGEWIQDYVPKATDANSEDPMVSNVVLCPTSQVVVMIFAKTRAFLVLQWNESTSTLDYKECVCLPSPILDATFDLEQNLWVSMAPESNDDPLVTVLQSKDGKHGPLPADDSRLEPILTAKVGLTDSPPDLFSIFGLRKFLDLPEYAKLNTEEDGPEEPDTKHQKV